MWGRDAAVKFGDEGVVGWTRRRGRRRERAEERLEVREEELEDYGKYEKSERRKESSR